jgi:hypothetical protein
MLDLGAHYGCGNHKCKHVLNNNSENMMIEDDDHELPRQMW